MVDGPEQASIEPFDEDKKHEPQVSPKTENSSIYAVSCKEKTAKEVESTCADFDEEKNKMDDVCRTDKHPSKMLDPSVSGKMENEPANALPGKKEPSTEATSVCNELDEENNNIDDWRKRTAKEAESVCCDLFDAENETDNTRH